MKQFLFVGILLAALAFSQSNRNGGTCVSWLQNDRCLPGQKLIVYYDFMQGANPQVLYDRGPNHLDGQRGATVGADPTDPAWTAGRGLTFGGSGQYVKLPQSPLLNFDNADVTVLVKIKTYSTGFVGTLLSRGGYSGGPPSGGWLLGTSLMTKAADNSNGYWDLSPFAFSASTVYTMGYTLHYSTSTTVGQSCHIYVNGSLADAVSPTNTYATGTSAPFFPFIGVRSGGNNSASIDLAGAFKGDVYALAIYSRILTAREIALYGARL